MKEGSDNFRSSAILGLISRIRKAGVDVIIYEPGLNESSFNGVKVFNSLSAFKDNSDIIVTNRYSENLHDIKHKVFTRDVFNDN
jgi:UDPglucose 6-dehydrogenase